MIEYHKGSHGVMKCMISCHGDITVCVKSVLLECLICFDITGICESYLDTYLCKCVIVR